MIGCDHLVMTIRNGVMVCDYCGFERKLKTYDDSSLEQLLAILPADCVMGIALDRALRSVRRLSSGLTSKKEDESRRHRAARRRVRK